MVQIDTVSSFQVILASKSPRRQALLREMGFRFSVDAKDIDESFPPYLAPAEAAEHIAAQKAKAYQGIKENQLIITADTIVCHEGMILGKPKDEQEAFRMLSSFSGSSHQVITAVALRTKDDFKVFHEVTTVFFRQLQPEEIDHYIRLCQPYDKAGAYGIQEWIGAVAIERIEGDYNNVVGLPTARLYKEMGQLLSV